ncbi:MAG: ABC transporter permease subunit [Ginsengibacter sp.]
MRKLIKYIVVDIMQTKIVLVYTFLLLVITVSIFNLENNSSKGLVSLLNIVVILVPLISIIFSTIYIYNSAEFIELLVSQPLKRKTIWLSLFAGLATSLSFAFLIGVGLPVLIYHQDVTGVMMVLMGVLLSIIFVSIATLSAVLSRDKAKGLGLSILLWLYFSLIFDVLVLFLLFQFQDYPLEMPMIAFSFFNPIDISRILILLKLDISALMGYTGAVFKDFFGTITGIFVTTIVMSLWILIPVGISVRKFGKRDL